MTAGSCQRARSASGSLYGSRTWTRPLERWSSLNTRPELAEAARRLRQLSHSQRAQLSMRGSQAVRSLRIGFSWARALVWWNARAASAAHRQLAFDWRPRTQPHSARPWLCVGFEPTSVQLARCNSEATTQAPAHRPTNGPLLASAGPATSDPYRQRAPQPASAARIVRLLRLAPTLSRPAGALEGTSLQRKHERPPGGGCASSSRERASSHSSMPAQRMLEHASPAGR